MDWWLLTFFLGAILSLFLPEVPAVFQLFLLLCLAIGFFCHKNLRLSSGLWFGACWLLTHAHFYHQKLPDNLLQLMLSKQALMVEGRVLSIQSKPVTSLDKKGGKKTQTVSTKRFNFTVDKIGQQQLLSPIIIRLSWKKPTLDLAQGQQLLLKVKLKPAHGLSNIGSFNYLSWLKANNISASGYVLNLKKVKSQVLKNDHELNRLKNSVKNQVISANTTFRQQLFKQYQRLAPEHDLTAILFALSFGDRSLLEPGIWRVLQSTGTSHLIAISGLHVGLLAGFTYLLVMQVIKYLPIKSANWQLINSHYLAIAVSILMASMYAYLAGFSLPTQRALVMLNIYWLSRLVGIKLTSKRLILLTLFIILIVSPFSLLTPSFWLSFYAVIIIFITLWRFKFWLNKGPAAWCFIKGLFIIQISLTVMLLPVTALFFQQISLVGLLANIIAVPWMSVFSIPSALLSVILMPLNEQLSQWLMMLSLQSITWLWHYLELLSKQSYAIILLPLVQQKLIVIAGIVVFVLIYLVPLYYSKRIKQVLLGLLASALTLGFLIHIFISYGLLSHSFITTSYLIVEKGLQSKDYEEQVNRAFMPWQAVFFDVGQGLSVLIKRNEHAILYDTGAAYPSGFTISDAVITPYLQHLGIDKIDKVILSHSDNDHAGGIKHLIAKVPIDEVISNDATIINYERNDGAINNIPLTGCQPDQSFIWQGLTFDILWPLATDLTDNTYNRGKQTNDDSCVILISDQYLNKLLLTGDISSKVELQLLKLYPQLSVDILQVPHHGSKTSSSQKFLNQLSPEVALVSAGYLNRWYMPVAAVRQRYLDSNIQFLNNAKLGQIDVSFDEHGAEVKNYVEDFRPFWFSH